MTNETVGALVMIQAAGESRPWEKVAHGAGEKY